MCTLGWMPGFGSLPYVLLLLLPLYASLVGTEYALRFSLLMFGFAGITSILPGIFAPVLSFIALFLAFITPLSVVPRLVISLYGLFLRFTDPLVTTVEVLMVVKFIHYINTALISLTDKNEALGKSLIVGVSALAYFSSFVTLKGVLTSSSSPSSSSSLENVQWIVAVLMCLLGAVHVVTVRKASGVISEAAMLSLASFLLLRVFVYEQSLTTMVRVKGLADRMSSSSDDSGEVVGDQQSSSSFLSLLLGMPNTTYVVSFEWNPSKPFYPLSLSSEGDEYLTLTKAYSQSSLMAGFSIVFWLLVLLRVASVASASSLLLLRSRDPDDSMWTTTFTDEDSDEDGGWVRSKTVRDSLAAVSLKWAAIASFTQLVLRTTALRGCANDDADSNDNCGGGGLFFLGGTWLRLGQCFGVGGVALVAMMKDDDDEDEWN